jgi:hypothetical protein
VITALGERTIAGALRCVVALLLAAILPACAPSLTPAQTRMYDAYYACRAGGYGDGVLQDVTPQGRATILGSDGLVAPLVSCINQHLRTGTLPACVGACTR